MSKRKLNPQQRVFLESYLGCWNATEAARKAGYRQPQSQGQRLLKNVEIQRRIQSRLKQFHLSTDMVLARLSEIACGNVADFLDATGNVDLGKVRDKGYLLKR